MIKIGKRPRILQNENRWGGLEVGFYVDNYYGYVEKDAWVKIQAFESFNKNQTVTPDNLGNFEWKLATLLYYSGGYQLWQLNMRTTDKASAPNEQHYIRTFAVLGEKTLKKRTIIDDIYGAFLQVKCYYLNKQVEFDNGQN